MMTQVVVSWPRRLTLALVFTLGATAAQARAPHEFGQAPDRAALRRQVHEHWREQRQAPQPPRPSADQSTRAAVVAPRLSPEERQSLRQIIREQRRQPIRP